MPASFKTFFCTFVFIILIILSGCSRDNPLSVPDEFIAPDTANCEVNLKLPELLTNVEITNTNIDYNYENIEGSEFDPNENEDTIAYLITSVDVITTLADENTFNLDLDAHNEALQKAYDEAPDALKDTLELPTVEKLNSFSLKLNDVKNNTDTRIALTNQNTEITLEVEATFSLYKSLPFGDKCVQQFVLESNGEKTDEKITENKDFKYVYKYKIERNEFDQMTSTHVELSSAQSNAEDEFGRAVSLNEFMTIEQVPMLRLAVGVYHDDVIANNSGAVYIYERMQNSTSDFNEPVLIKAGVPDAGDMFGYSVSLSESFLAVSAPGEDSALSGVFPWLDTNGDGENDNKHAEVSNLAESSGAVYIFQPDNANGWKQVAYIKPPINLLGVDGYDNAFGSNVLLQGNLLLISAPKDDSATNELKNDVSRPNSGAVYIYEYSSGDESWNFSHVLKANDPGVDDAFGSALAMHDGVIAVGAPGESSSLSTIVGGDAGINALNLDDDSKNSGAVYIFNPLGDNWRLSTLIKASNNDAGDAFGTSISMDSSWLFVGANQEDSNGTFLNRNKDDNSVLGSGAVYGFNKLTEEQWMEFAYIKADVPQEGAQFGQKLVFNNNNLIVGSPLYNSGDSLGRVYSYKFIDNELEVAPSILFTDTQQDITAENSQSDARFGSEIAIHGHSLAVGAKGFTNRETGNSKEHSGKVYIYQ